HVRRRLRRLANGRTRPGQGDQPAGHLRRQSERDGGAGERGLERWRPTRLRARSGGGGACRTQARRQLSRRGRERPDGVARESSHHILCHRAGRGSKGKSEDEAAFPYSTASWFFVDAVEMMAPADSFAIVAFGDSITDGTASTMNGDDRWPDVLSRRLHAVHG